MRRLVYFIRVTLGSVRQNLLVNLVAVGTISLALLILSGFVLLYLNLQNLVETSRRELGVSVYLAEDLKAGAVEKLKQEVAQIPGVAGVRHVSKAQALAELKRRLGDQGALLDGLETNPLPASLELELEPRFRARGPVKELLAELKGLSGAAEVHYAWEWADKLAVFVNFVHLSGLILGGLLFLATVFIVANTVKLTVYARQDELYILRLMGATETFIRTPFVLEGVLQGLWGGLAALAVLFGLFKILVSQVQLPLGLSVLNLSFLPPAAAWGVIGAGVFMGFLGSLISVGRFLEA